MAFYGGYPATNLPASVLKDEVTFRRRAARDDWDALTLSSSGKLNQAFGALANRSMERARKSAGSLLWTGLLLTQDNFNQIGGEMANVLALKTQVFIHC